MIKNQKALWALAFIGTNLILFIIFFLGPALLGLYYSFTDYSGISASFIGLNNYIQLFQDGSFYGALFRTIVYAGIGVPLIYCVSLGVSLLLTSYKTRGKGLAKIAFFFPWLISPIIAGVIWRWLFGESFGFVNFILENLGLSTVSWFSNGIMAFAVLFFASVWIGTAFNMLLFMSALVNIPGTYYDAAKIDGANTIQKFWHITLPALRPTSFMVILLSVFNLMKEFPLVQSLTNGGPGSDTTLLVQYIYETGFNKLDIGYASAASMILFVLLLVFSLLQLRSEKRWQN
ncbi:carbohydrate ABC transporter permease [Salibacterium halotolerans]|uniref:Alpha-1,4-digalacturonate transport system permease protein n=1 Tax=Salibacterium halotolerans TaxID=1884432 RepID=A0A1I5X9Y8_9BACI|nr:sugar ABC transporter permease [Salibacterium halotolerans]SFQ28780.1 alpha-1,4-digalacturonate transport system permease protein [Salibacterium halotolerans]